MAKAFNNIDHNLVIQDLSDMNCPSWLLRIFISYLSNRTLIVKFRDATAVPRPLHAGSPQGTALGIIIFIIKFNGACLRPEIPRKKINDKIISVKFVDDTSSACEINLRQTLVRDPIERPKPNTWHENNQLVLPKDENPLQTCLDELWQFTIDQKMSINQEKTKVMIFNLTKKYQFLPELCFLIMIYLKW